MTNYARWQSTITDAEGNVQPGASVEVRLESVGAPLATLYSDRTGLAPIGNPVVADADGFVYFHVTGGAYKITASFDGETRIWRYVGIGLGAETDFVPAGTTNYLAKYSSAIALGISVIYDDGANVGINTITPDARLSVNGVASFGAGAAALPSIAAFGDLDTGWWFPAANTLAGSTGGTERVRIDSAGKVGIANTSPQSPFDVLGGSTTAVNGRGSIAALGSGITKCLAFGVNEASTMYSWIQSIEHGSALRALAINPQGGNVGIGTTSPQSQLTVAADGATADLALHSYVASSGAGNIIGRKARGSVASPGAISANDRLLAIFGQGYTSSAAYSGSQAALIFYAAEAFSSSAQGTYFAFETTPVGSTSRAERVRITDAGNVKIAGTANRGTTEGTNHLDIFDGTAPVGTLANGVSLYSASGVLKAKDAAGNAISLDTHILRDDTSAALGKGFYETPFSNGTVSSGTLTPDAANNNLQYYTNNGAHTLAPPSSASSILMEITNGASAGAITTSGFTKVTGDAFTTTNAHKFLCTIVKSQTYSLLNVVALQ